jgi:hypothetical protein
METAKERFLRAISRPSDRTCRPPQRGGKWIIAGYMISHLFGLSFLIVLYTYLFTNQKNLLHYLFTIPGAVINFMLVISFVGIAKLVGTKRVIFISLFFMYDIIVSIIFLVVWFYTVYLFIISFSATSGRAFNVAASTFMYALLGLFFFWVVPVGLYFLVTTPWWQPWAKKEQWYNPDDDKAAHPDRR